jgi:hypothetical protein
MITPALTATDLSRSVLPDDPAVPRLSASGAVQFDKTRLYSRNQAYLRFEDESFSHSAKRGPGSTGRIPRGRDLPGRTARSWLTNSFRTSIQLVGGTLDFALGERTVAGRLAA